VLEARTAARYPGQRLFYPDGTAEARTTCLSRGGRRGCPLTVPRFFPTGGCAVWFGLPPLSGEGGLAWMCCCCGA
jgi:hypothetical protein